MKKLSIALLLITVLTLGALGLVGCDFIGNDPTTVSFGDFESEEQIYGFSAASAATLISAMNGGQAANTSQAKALALAGTEVDDEATINELNEYMMLVESLLSEGKFGFEVTESDVEGYAAAMRISYVDMTGETISYQMYYNETVIDEHRDRDDDDDDFFDEEEIETTSRIDGILRIDGVDYPMSGRSESSVEGDETETEHSLTVTLSDTSTLRVEQSVENERGENEQEYSYSLYEGRNLIERSEFSFEQERDETEIELTMRSRNESGGYTTNVFTFDKEIERGAEVIRIRVGTNASSDVYIVSIRTNDDGTTEYVYTNARGSYRMDRD